MVKYCSKCNKEADFYDCRGSRPYCVECTKQVAKDFYLKNATKIKNRIKVKYRTNKEYFKESDSRWRRAHPEIKNAGRYRYKARKIGATGNFTAEEWLSLCKKFDNKCVCCGSSDKLTLDHIMPLSKGGANSIDNIQPLCLSCNCSKKDKHIDYRYING